MRTLANVHRLNISHRDSKPEDILIHTRGIGAGAEDIGEYGISSEVLLTDFGITFERVTAEGVPTGTDLTFDEASLESVKDDTAHELTWMRTGPIAG